jgi:hypothetical protein
MTHPFSVVGLITDATGFPIDTPDRSPRDAGVVRFPAARLQAGVALRACRSLSDTPPQEARAHRRSRVLRRASSRQARALAASDSETSPSPS